VPCEEWAGTGAFLQFTAFPAFSGLLSYAPVSLEGVQSPPWMPARMSLSRRISLDKQLKSWASKQNGRVGYLFSPFISLL
jgi:hypothetical protein